MRKAVFFIFIAISAVSCKRVYQCQCTRIINNETWDPKVTNLPVEARGKKNAEALCSSNSYNFGWQDYQECRLK